MKHPTRLLPLLAATASLWAAPPTGGQPSADWIKRTKDRIEQLLGPQRNRAPLAPAEAANPFRMPGKTAPDTPQTGGEAVPPKYTDSDILARLVATLKISGLINVGGTPQVIINQLSYKEGDLVAVREGEQVTYLRLTHIAPGGATLELNDAQTVVRLK